MDNYEVKKQMGIHIALFIALGVIVSRADAKELIADSITPYCSYLPEGPVNKGPDGKVLALTMCEVIGAALEVSPELEALAIGVDGSNGRMIKALVAPNPSLDASVENFGGSGAKKDFSAAEVTVLWNHPIELGNKRDRRQEIARSEKALLQADYGLKRADIIQGVKTAFIGVWAAKENLALCGRRKTLADDSMAATQRRVSAGSGSAVEAIKAKISLSNSEIALEQARREFAAATRKLAVYLARPGDLIDIRGMLEVSAQPPSWDVIEKAVPRSLDLKRVDLEANRRKATVLLEEARAYSDVTVAAGIRHSRENNTTGFVAGLSVPLPLYDRNLGAIFEAKKSVAANVYEEKAEIFKVQTALKDAYEAMVASHERAEKLRSDVLQNAERGLEVANKAYRLGKLNFLDALDAQRSLFDAREEYVRSLTSYYTAQALTERLLGMGFGQLINAK